MNENMLRELLSEMKLHIQATDKLILLMEHKLRNIEHVTKLSQQITLQEEKVMHIQMPDRLTNKTSYVPYTDTIQSDFHDHSLIKHSIEKAKLNSLKQSY